MDTLSAPLLHALMQQVHMGLILLDSQMRVTGWNAFLAERSPLFNADLYGRSFVEAFPEANSLSWKKMVTTVNRSGQHAFVQWQDNPYLIALPASDQPSTGLMLPSVFLAPFKAPDQQQQYAVLIFDASRAQRLDAGLEQALSSISSRQQELSELKAALEQANNQLLQSEKLASIGQLAAGVAHEINNPIGYVFSNLKSLAGYVEDLLRIVDGIDSLESLQELRQLKQRLEYSYIRDDIKDLLSESEDGIDRVKRIIAAMKDFSHIGDESFQPVDLHRGIETTLNVVNNEIKYKAEVVREFGELPEVECIASQITKVVMNLLVNACHAIESFSCISIRNGCQGDQAWIEIEDTGKGMDEQT